LLGVRGIPWPFVGRAGGVRVRGDRPLPKPGPIRVRNSSGG